MNTSAQRAAIYARVSSHRQQKQATIESQLAELRERARQDGVCLLEEHIVIDEGHSGSYLDRPGLDRLRDLVHERLIDVVYVHSPDRLARRYAYQAILVEEFDRAGCQLIFLNQAPSQDPEGQLLVQIQGVIAEYERAKITERMRRGKLYRARQGVVLSWKAPYGYRYVPRQLEAPGNWEINPDEAPAIPALFGWVRDEGISTRQATIRLNASSWRPRGGRPLWAVSSVRSMLTNPAYTGVCYYNKRRWIESDRTDRLFRKNHKTKCVLRPQEEWIPIPIPSLIDEPTFTAVQEQLKTNRAFSPRNLHREGEYLLRCLVSCGVCGRTMVAHSYGKHTYYHCAGNVDPVYSSLPRRCPAPLVYAPDLDRLVWKEISALLTSPQTLLEAYKQQQGREGLHAPDLIEAELQRLQMRIGDAQRQIQRLLDGYQSGLIYAGEFSKRRAAVEEKIGRWIQERERLESERPKWRETKEVFENLSLFCQHVGSGLGSLNFDDKQKLLRKIIERIHITGWQVKVKLAIPLSTKLDLTPLGFLHPARPARLVRARSQASWPSVAICLCRDFEDLPGAV